MAVKLAAIVVLDMSASAPAPFLWLIVHDPLPLWAAEAVIRAVVDPRHFCFGPSGAVAGLLDVVLVLLSGAEWYAVGLMIRRALNVGV